MARGTKDVNKSQNVKIQPNKVKKKSKYFDKTRKNSAKRAVKHLGKQKLSESGKDRKNLPNLGALSALNRSNASFNPQAFGKRLTRDFFDTPTESLALALLGKVLCRKTKQGDVLGGKIIETEAYLGEIDPACHSYGGKRTARNAPMYGPPGTAYVYFIYGMYHCFNISSKEPGACVLIRALEPLAGLDKMRQLRDAKRKETSKPLKDHYLTNGPSKLCTALDITKDKLNSTDMAVSKKFWIEDNSLTESKEFSVVHTTRIGIDSYGEEAAQKLYRYYILGNKHVSIRDKNAEKDVASTM